MLTQALDKLTSKELTVPKKWDQLVNEMSDTPVQNPDPKALEALEIKIIGGKMRLYKVAPYLGRILSELHIKIVDTVNNGGIKTMAVDDFQNIYINPNFAKELSDDEFYAVFAHEALHIANGTFLRKGERNMTIWNIATDAVMNYALSKDGFKLPKCGIIPDPVNGTFTFEHEKPPFTIKVTDQSGHPLSSEEVYKQLKQKVEEENKKNKGKGKGKPEIGDGDSDGEGDGEPIDMKDLPPDMQREIMRRLREYDNKMDKHLTKKQAKEVNKDLIEDLTPDKQKQLEAQRQAKIEAELNKSSATQSDALGATIRTLLQKTFETKVDWRAIIRQYLRVAETKTQTWLKPARRGLGGGYYSPGNISNSDKFDAVFAIDTSGSIGDQPLNVFITAINEMAKQAKNINVRILLWHTEAYYMSPPITQKGALQEVFKRMHLQSGGTHIGCVPPFLVKMKVKPVVCVFLTDGYVEPSPQLAGSYQKLFIVLPMSQTVAAAKQQMENLFKHYGQVVILPSIE